MNTFGLNSTKMAEQVRKGRMIVRLPRPATMYAGLDYLDPILELKPVTHTRRNISLQAITGFQLERYSKEGEKIFRGKLAKLAKELGYDKLFRKPQEIMEGYAITSYIDLHCLGYKHLVRNIVEEGNSEDAAYKLLIYSDFLVAPIMGGLFGQSQVTRRLALAGIKLGLLSKTRKSTIFPVEVGRILIEEYGLNFPLNAEMEYLDKLYRDRVMRLARKVLSELERAIKEARALPKGT